MKRLIATIVIVALLIPVFSFPAYAKHDGEILFRDIPWGSTYEEVMEALNDLDVKWREPHEFNYRSVYNIFIGKSNDDSSFVPIYTVYGTPNSSLKVGGFDVEYIKLYFARTTENGQVLDDIDHTFFYIAEYKLKKTDPSNEDNDIMLLNKKLAGIYGSYDSRDYTWTFSCTIYFYNGKNNTQVVPVNEFHEVLGSLNELRLYYICKDGDTIAEKTNQILFDLAAQTDTEGL